VSIEADLEQETGKCRTWSAGADRTGSATASGWPLTRDGSNDNQGAGGFDPALTPRTQTSNPPA